MVWYDSDDGLGWQQQITMLGGITGCKSKLEIIRACISSWWAGLRSKSKMIQWNACTTESTCLSDWYIETILYNKCLIY